VSGSDSEELPPEARTGRDIERRVSRKELEKVESDDEPAAVVRKRVRKKKHRLTVSENQPSFETAPSETPTVISEIDEVCLDERLLLQLLEVLLGEGAFDRQLPRSLNALPEFADGLKTLPRLEEQQIARWYKKGLAILSAQGIEELSSDYMGIDEMIVEARRLLIKQRIVNPQNGVHRLNIGIVGPEQSGKSILLRVLSEEVIGALTVTGEWKTTFLFVLDFRALAPIFIDYPGFYRAIVSHTFRHLHWQVPNFVGHFRMLQAFFESIILYTAVPTLPKTFTLGTATRRIAPYLQKIANRLSEYWNDQSALFDWIKAVLSFPMEIAEVFGFVKNVFILDHFDLTDIALVPQNSPFIESPAMFSLADMVKSVLNRANFIVACHDEERFYSLLPSVSPELNSDFHSRIQFVNLVGLISNVDNADKQFQLEVSDEPLPLSFTVEMCGGIPAYVQIWDELNAAWEMIEQGDADSDDEDILLAARFQELLRIFFVQSADNDYQFEITHCRRTTRRLPVK
jgi:hypothetical protein